MKIRSKESLGKGKCGSIHNLSEHLMNLYMQEAQQKEDSEEVIPKKSPTNQQVTGSQANYGRRDFDDSLGTQNAAVKPKFLALQHSTPTSSTSSFIKKYERTALKRWKIPKISSGTFLGCGTTMVQKILLGIITKMGGASK
ncbi:hypothetical protein JTB14_030510 [Gonioctena quinquepunctata]|nr:hypothetical protein JTB14_030510 [Gonioctena quinquepunctata]